MSKKYYVNIKAELIVDVEDNESSEQVIASIKEALNNAPIIEVDDIELDEMWEKD